MTPIRSAGAALADFAVGYSEAEWEEEKKERKKERQSRTVCVEATNTWS